jgi:hypothetical protein
MQFIKKSLFAAALALVSVLATPAWSASLDLVPTTSVVTEGDTLTVNLVISGLTDGEQLSTFDLVVNFDSTVLSFSSYLLSDLLGSLTSYESYDASSGLIADGQLNLALVSLLSDLSTQSTTFTLATLTFSALAAGQSALTLSDVTLGDAVGATLTADLGSTLVNVSAVPEPGTSAMLLAGLGLLGLMARRRIQG